MEYKEIIDNLLKEMEQEITSAHELTTKALNIEYAVGQLYGLYNIAKKLLPYDQYIELYDYRRNDRDNISGRCNREVINKVYSIVRDAERRKIK